MNVAARFSTLTLMLSLLATAAQANEALIKKKLTERFPGASITSVKRTPYSGLFEVYFEGQLIYTDARAQYVFNGDVIDLNTRRNLTQARLAQLQTIKWDNLPFQHAIKTVKGKGERKLAVFSDVDCPFCRKFEAELAKVDNVTIYTFVHPVESLHPRAVLTSKKIWCAPDRNKAWDDYITKGVIPSNEGNCANPVEATMELGSRLKVTGTPTIFFVNGQRVPGMVPAAQLEKLLAAAQ